MKIRNGFVSNSSSSSFVLFGVKLKPKSLLKNEEFKKQFDEEFLKEEQEELERWNKKLGHPNFQKNKEVYDMCKANGVSIPSEVKSFFGYNFNGVYEPSKPDESEILTEMINEEKFKFPKGIKILSDDGDSYLGKLLSYGSDELDYGSISIEELETHKATLLEMGLELKDIKLFFGTVAC
jgi:hypothetical protein